MTTKTYNVELTYDEIIMIGDALNGRAKEFDDLAETVETAPDHSRAIWKKAAEERFALTKRLVAQTK